MGIVRVGTLVEVHGHKGRVIAVDGLLVKVDYGGVASWVSAANCEEIFT